MIEALLLTGWVVAAVGAFAALARARQMRRRAAHASHELRGPLTAAQLALDGLALRGELDRAGAAPVHLQLRRARLALDDLLLGPVAHHPEPVTLAALLADLEAAWRPVALAQSRALAVEPAAEGLVIADRTRLAQAVGNLVANALEHGEGTVVLTARVRDGVAHLAVRDQGAGPAGTRERTRKAVLMDAMRWVATRELGFSAAARAGRARGHGLRIAAQIAEGADGRLTIDGAAVTVILPLADPALAPAARALAERVMA